MLVLCIKHHFESCAILDFKSIKILFKVLLFFSIFSLGNAQDSFELLLGKAEQQNDLSLASQKRDYWAYCCPFSEKSILMSSLKYNHFLRSKSAKDISSYANRAGYIHGEEKYSNRAFVFAWDDLSRYYHLHNYIILKDSESHKSLFCAIANEFGYHFSQTNISLMLAYLVAIRSSLDTDNTIKLANFKLPYDFDELIMLKGSLWVSVVALGKRTYKNGLAPISPNDFRLISENLSSLDSFKKLEFATDNITKNNYFNLNSVVVYKHSIDLELNLKTANILSKPEERNYFGLNQEPILAYLPPPLNDRATWFGVEYLF